jgi:HK97 family phage major capsid protein
MPKSYKEKAAEARALIAQVKAMHNDTKSAGTSGIDSGEKAAEAHKIMAKAATLATEAKADRLAEENDRTKALLEQYEGKGHVSGDPDLLAERKGDAVALADIGKHTEKLVIHKDLARHLYGTKGVSNLKAANMKVLAEGAGAGGEFLVVPEYHQEMFAAVRSTNNSLRSLGWVNSHPTRSNKILIPKGAGATTMAWVGQNQPAPSTDPSTTQLTVNVFKAVGIAKVTFELDSDSDPAAMDMAIEDLGRRAAILEEQAWLYGGGTTESFGILNTPGVLTKTYGATIDTAQEQIDYVLDQAMDVLTNFYAPANGVLVSGRRYAFWRKAKDSNNNYLFNLAGSTRAPGQVTKSPYDGGDILGLPIGISANLPTNLGGTTNEDRIIVADWSEAHAFIRLDLTIDFNDKSDTAWSNDQQQVRLKFRQGFTAERFPKAFSVGGGAGLASTLL